MNEQAYIALATLAFLVASAGFGWLWSILVKIGDRLAKIADKVDSKAAELITMVERNAQKNQARHEETIQRLTRVETLVGNGNGARKKRAMV